MARHYDVVAIGNAIVDVFAPADDSFLAENRLVKGAMTLIDPGQAIALYAKMGAAVEVSGGSAANTAAGIASLGGRAAFVGKVSADQLGEVFAHDIRAVGVTFETPPIVGLPPTARSFIIVTPDAQRTMHTYLGACVELGPADIDPALISAAEITYMEGYLWDKPAAKDAFLKAAEVAHAAGRQVSLTLSDTFCVERHRESFRTLVARHVDVVFANEREALALYQVETLEETLELLRGQCRIAVVTRSERGSIVVSGPATYEVPAEPVARVADTTGAGDLYAAGFLHGLVQDRHLAECARIGGIAAAEVISHVGARPQTGLAALVARRLAA